MNKIILLIVVSVIFVAVPARSEDKPVKPTFVIEKVEILPDKIVFTLPKECEYMSNKEWDERVIPITSAYIMLNKEKEKIPDGEWTIYRKGRTATYKLQ